MADEGAAAASLQDEEGVLPPANRPPERGSECIKGPQSGFLFTEDPSGQAGFLATRHSTQATFCMQSRGEGMRTGTMTNILKNGLLHCQQ